MLVQRGIHDAFVDRLAAGVRALRVGPGFDPSTHVGPAVSKAQQERVLDYLRIGQREGATVAAQAVLPTDPDLADGFYMPATLLTGVTRDMRVAVEEIFGPVRTVTVFDTEDDAVAIANRVARRIDSGMVLINNYSRNMLGTPFGGTKHSGFGREHALETLKEFSAPKMIRFPSGLGTPPSWRAVTDVYGTPTAVGATTGVEA